MPRDLVRLEDVSRPSGGLSRLAPAQVSRVCERRAGAMVAARRAWTARCRLVQITNYIVQ